MRKLILSVAIAAALALTTLLSAAPALADPLPDNCRREQGTVYCVEEDTPGNNRGGVTKTETTSQKGSLQSSHPEEDEGDCVENRGGIHCK